jgi:geranylgeranyl pyrophosphate synthase
VEAVKNMYDQLSIGQKTKDLMDEYFAKAFALLDQLEVDPAKKQWLVGFGKKLAEREQ